jgi:hypothetical protein
MVTVLRGKASGGVSGVLGRAVIGRLAALTVEGVMDALELVFEGFGVVLPGPVLVTGFGNGGGEGLTVIGVVLVGVGGLEGVTVGDFVLLEPVLSEVVVFEVVLIGISKT